MDSTKKVVKKLAGDAAGTAAWSTNVSSEYGQVLISVLTAGEGYGLDPMARGITERYSNAEVSPPELLYMDSQCCGKSPVVSVFRSVWPDLNVRLDIWHFMRRFSTSVTTDTHRLYRTFMSQLSHCIFQWDQADLALLKRAKRSEMVQAHISDPSDNDIIRRLSRKEMALHCRHSTRGQHETEQMILQLLEMFDSEQGTDTMGVLLFSHDRIWEIWKSQKGHIACFQDPAGIPLYIQTGKLKKGGIELPVYRCARGSTSLESFHLHLLRFIPGTTASATHFQAYLLEGLMRWNQDRADAALDTNLDATCYSGILRFAANELGEDVLRRKLYPGYKAPNKYTGEKIGVKYLYSQTGQELRDLSLPETAETAEEELTEDENIDEGFEDVETEDQTVALVESFLPIRQIPDTSSGFCCKEIAPNMSVPSVVSSTSVSVKVTCSVPQETQQDVIDPVPVKKMQSPEDDSVEPDNIKGFDRVDALAEYLVSLKESSSRVLNNEQADQIITLWHSLLPYDRSSTKFSPRHQTKLIKGRFKAPKSMRVSTAGFESVRRCFLGPNAGPAQWPDCNRYVEAVVSKLCLKFSCDSSEGGKRHTRWSLVMSTYRLIKDMVHNSQRVMDQTNIQLVDISHKTLTQWYVLKLFGFRTISTAIFYLTCMVTGE